MIKIESKGACCGCNACGDICAHNAITFKRDNEGFLYPQVDEKLCTNCGLCEQICPEMHIEDLKYHNASYSPTCYAVNNKNIETRFDSTSGGVFSALADEMYRRGGYVGGAIYGENWEIKHFISNNPEDLQHIRQSKYSQSDATGFYKEVRDLLKKGEKVLVCGTPCQMVALRRFIGKDYDNLIIVDFICKYVASPMVVEKYIEYQERENGSKVTYFKYKDKELGWRSLNKRIDFKNGRSIYTGIQNNDILSMAFHSNMIGRPSCYECQFKGSQKVSDITMGDFWGCEKFAQYKELDDNVGTSAIICNTQKGEEYFTSIKQNVNAVPAELDHIVQSNPHLNKPAAIVENRAAFFDDLQRESIEVVVAHYCAQTPPHPGKLKSIFKNIKLICIAIKKQWKFGNKSLVCLCSFIKWNVLSKQIKTDLHQLGFLFIAPHVEVDIAKSAIIDLQSSLWLYAYSSFRIQENAKMECGGSMEIGVKPRFPKSKLETCFLLANNAHYVNTSWVSFAYGSHIEVHESAELLMDEGGSNVNCTIICAKKIEMKGHVSMGRDVSIRDTNAHIIALDGYKVMRPVLIEDHVWLCSGATICPGVKVHTGAIVGANSYVVRSVPAHSLVSGSPAQIVERNIAWQY